MNAAEQTRPARWRLALIITGAVIVALTLLVVLFDGNWIKGPIERRVADATGREFSIGDLDIDLGLRTKVRARDIHLGNARWSRKPEMASAATVEMSISLPTLLRGRIDLPYVSLDKPRVLIERDAQGRGNWQFKRRDQRPEAKRESQLPLIRDLLVRDGEVKFLEVKSGTDLRLTLRSLEPDARNERAPLLARGKGTFRDFPFELEGRIDSPLELQDSDEPFNVDLRASAGETKARARGASRTPLQFDAFKIRLELSGENLADLWLLAGLPLPDTPPYSLNGELERDGAVWSYHDFKGNVGDSDMSGDVTLDTRDERPLLKANVTSKNLDFDDLAGLLNAPPSVKEGETASTQQRREAEERKARPRVLPDKPYDLGKFRVMDADVRFQAEHIDAPKLPLDRMTAHLVLKDGVARIDPLDFDAAGGQIASHVTLDASKPSISTTMTADVRRLELPKLFPQVDITRSGAGVISGAVAVTAQGNSVAHMAGSANGNIGLIMGPGKISHLLIELAGLDIAESLKYLFDKNKQVTLRCAYASFKVQDGSMTTQSLGFDTNDTVLFGEGTLDLRAETLKLRLVPQPKDVSPLVVRVPLHVGGTFKDPSFLPEPAPLAARAAAAAALYAIAPPAALLALIETGPGEDIDCGPAQQRSGSS